VTRAQRPVRPRARRRPRDGRRCGDRLSLRGALGVGRLSRVDLSSSFRASSSPRCCSRSGTRARPSNWAPSGAPSAPAPAGLLVMLAAVALYVALDGRFGPPASSLVDLSGLRATACHVVLRRQLALDLRPPVLLRTVLGASPSSNLVARHRGAVLPCWPLVILALVSVTDATGAAPGSCSASRRLASASPWPCCTVRHGPDHGLFRHRHTAFDMLPARPSPCSALRAHAGPAARRCSTLPGCCQRPARLLLDVGRKRRRAPARMDVRGGFLACAVLARSSWPMCARCNPEPRPRAVAPADPLGRHDLYGLYLCTGRSRCS